MWIAVGSAERPPSRRDLKPESIPGALADTWLMDYEAATRRLYYRLVGEHIRARHDFPLVGRHLGEVIDPEVHDRVLPYFRACVEKPAISIVLGRLYHERDRPGYGERLLLPLLTPEGTPEGLIGTTICKVTFDSRLEAEERAKRVILMLPLDGAPVIEEVT